MSTPVMVAELAAAGALHTAASVAAVPPARVVMGRFALNDAQVELLKATVCKGATDDELKLFLYVCEKTQLDPFVRQIYAIKRGGFEKVEGGREERWVEKIVHQVAIDGLRLTAQRSGEYTGQTQPVFYNAAGNAHKVWLDAAPPFAAEVGVYRRGFVEPMMAVARWSEYAAVRKGGGLTAMWAKFPTGQIAKCAEALALRRAFPMECSGLYVHEEMEHADALNEPPTPAPVVATGKRPVEDVQATVTPDGGIKLGVGKHHGERITAVPTSYLIASFRDPWRDQGRRKVAEERMGAGFVGAIYAELERRFEAGDPLLAPRDSGGST